MSKKDTKIKNNKNKVNTKPNTNREIKKNTKKENQRGFKKGHEPYSDVGIRVKYNGIEYKSVAALCRELDIRLSSFRSYISYKNKNLPESERKEIGEYVDGYLKKHSTYTAPDGKVYKSFSDCCRKTGVSYGAAYNRIKRGSCSKEDIFSKDKLKRTGREIKDHLGNIYPSISAMCRKYNISMETYDAGIRNGMSIEKILSDS